MNTARLSRFACRNEYQQNKLAGAFVFRFNNRSDLSLSGDEDYNYFAAKGILKNGVPAMASAMMHIRGMFHPRLTVHQEHVTYISVGSVTQVFPQEPGNYAV
jgi:hypothetical protein